jgi:60 kDa SS-A/Ro ribonucleoprotein
MNSCGKPIFEVTEWELLKRYLMLGCENGTYYISENNLKEQNIISLDNILKDESNNNKLISLLIEYNNKVYKKEYILQVFAKCCATKTIRKEAYNIINTICKIPTHLFMFIEFYEKECKKLNHSTGWNKLHKDSIGNWYLNIEYDKLEYFITKYKKRNNWSHIDLLRLSHIKTSKIEYDSLFKYITKNYNEYLLKTNNQPSKYLEAYEKLKNTNDYELAIQLIKDYKFVREHVPTLLLNNCDVWNQLVQDMPMVALLRNLNKITNLEVFTKYPDTLNKIIDKLSTKDNQTHPLQYLISLKTYSQGHGYLGELNWKPNKKIIESLNIAYKLSFKNIESTGKRYLLALDISGSMHAGRVCGIDCMSSIEISCAMAMIIDSIEPNCDIMSFSTEFQKLNINNNDSLEQNIYNLMNLDFGATDCSLPMLWSIENKKNYDAIIIFTDSETNSNFLNPSDALKEYRKKMNNNCKLIVIATCANNFSLADPCDPFGMLDIAGFNADTPNIINDFIMIT